jgi:hypothetical protein
MKIICAEVGQKVYGPNKDGIILFPKSAKGQMVKFTAELDKTVVPAEIKSCDGYLSIPLGADASAFMELPPQQTDPVWNGAV